MSAPKLPAEYWYCGYVGGAVPCGVGDGDGDEWLPDPEPADQVHPDYDDDED